MRLWIVLGALSGFIAVALGAFAAHGLQARVSPAELAVFETGARYQMYHALAMVLLGLFCAQSGNTATTIAGLGFAIGTLLFSGSLYYLGLTGSRALVLVTPVGGLAFLIGWLSFAWAAWQGRPTLG